MVRKPQLGKRFTCSDLGQKCAIVCAANRTFCKWNPQIMCEKVKIPFFFLTRDCRRAPSPPAQSDRRNSRPRRAHSDWGSGQNQPWPSTGPQHHVKKGPIDQTFHQTITEMTGWASSCWRRCVTGSTGWSLDCSSGLGTGIERSLSIEMFAAHPSPDTEGKGPLDGTQWDTSTCFAASQMVVGAPPAFTFNLPRPDHCAFSWYYALAGNDVIIHPYCVMNSWSIQGTRLLSDF